MIDSKGPSSASRDTKWVEGLRGLAAIFVMTSHIALGYADFLEAPRRANQPAWWYNAPFFRVIFEGSPWVSIFLILTGFVNSLKPLKQARSGNADAAYAGLASSCFRRSLRLMLPCTVATFMCWILAEFGAFKTGSKVMSNWMSGTSALPSGGVGLALLTLFRAILDTWSWNNNELERNQWAMLFFLKGALAVYVYLLATVKTHARYRMWISAILVAYGWRGLDPFIFMPIFTGVLLAEISMTSFANAMFSGRRVIRAIPYVLLVAGWYCISFPNRYQRRMAWSDHMLATGLTLFPKGSDIHAYYGHIGATCITTAIMLSGSMQRVLNLRLFQWLGARSFPIYLVHGPVLRSFMNWIIIPRDWPTVFLDEKDDQGTVIKVYEMYPIPPPMRFVWAIPLFILVTLILSDLWLRHVEPMCAKIAKKIEDRVWIGDTATSSVVEKVDTIQFALAENSYGSPISRATTPMNEVEMILPR